MRANPRPADGPGRGDTQLLTLPGRIVSHARAWILKLYSGFPLAGAFATAREPLLQLAGMLHPAPA